MQPLGRHDMRPQPIEQRYQRRGAGAHMVGQGGQAQRHALTGRSAQPGGSPARRAR